MILYEDELTIEVFQGVSNFHALQYQSTSMEMWRAMAAILHLCSKSLLCAIPCLLEGLIVIVFCFHWDKRMTAKEENRLKIPQD